MAHQCVACAAPLEPEDGHDRESLTDSACMNCSLLPWVLRVARLAELENRATANNPSSLMRIPPNQPGRSGQQRHDWAAATGAPPKKKARAGLAAELDGLAADMEQMRFLLLALQPGTGQGLVGLQPGPPSSQFDDALSLAALSTLFNEWAADTSGSLEAAARARQTRQQLSGLNRMGPLLAGLGAPRQSPSGAFSHLITPVAYGGLSGLCNSLRMAFGPPNTYLPGSLVPHNPTDAPPEPQEAGGGQALGPQGRSSGVFPIRSSVTGLPVLQSLGWFPP
ncbi:unnamed protein product [Boreogadus saida]